MKRGLFLIVVPIVLTVVVIVGVYIAKEVAEPKETAIIEFENLRILFFYTRTDTRYFIVENPPKDLNQLKDAVEAYILDYDDAYPSDAKGVESHTWYFFRTSGRLNKNWVPNDGYLSEDQINHHMDDLIVMVWWDAGEERAHYVLYERSGFGKILSRCDKVGAKPDESLPE